MADLWTTDGSRAGLRVAVWDATGCRDASGRLDAARVQAQVPVAVLPADPRVLVDDHARDLAFDVARARPDLAGMDLEVGVRTVPGDVERLMLEVRGPGPEPWTARRVLALMPLTPESVQARFVLAAARDHGLDPKLGVFGLQIGPPAGEATNALLSVRRPAKAIVTVQVPELAAGDLPQGGSELSAARASPDDLPVAVPGALLRQLALDEAAFAAAASDSWRERAWLLTGRLTRDSVDGPAVALARALPADDVTATVASVRFSPATWESLLARLEAGERPVGWLHTHSLSRLAAATETAEAPEKLKSGLFLSDVDRENARTSFRAPWMVTVVMCSDAARREPVAALDDVFGVWGWQSGVLVRRSVRVMED